MLSGAGGECEGTLGVTLYRLTQDLITQRPCQRTQLGLEYPAAHTSICQSLHHGRHARTDLAVLDKLHGRAEHLPSPQDSFTARSATE